MCNSSRRPRPSASLSDLWEHNPPPFTEEGDRAKRGGWGKAMRRGQIKIKQLALIVLCGALASCASIPWRSDIAPADFMKHFGYKPLKEGAHLPDTLRLYSSRDRSLPLVTEIVIGEKVKFRQSTFYPANGMTRKNNINRRLKFSKSQSAAILLSTKEAISRRSLFDIQMEDKAETIIICVHEPTYFANLRINGVVASGKLESCGYPQTYELVCEIETGAKCKQ